MKSGSFALGDRVFGEGEAEVMEQPISTSTSLPDETASHSDDAEDSEEDENEVVTAMASLQLEDSRWKITPTYPPSYLSTTEEYLPHVSKSRTSQEEALLEEAAERESKDAGWGMEGYENSMNTDQIFERFARRVGSQGEQCIRYVSFYHSPKRCIRLSLVQV